MSTNRPTDNRGQVGRTIGLVLILAAVCLAFLLGIYVGRSWESPVQQPSPTSPQETASETAAATPTAAPVASDTAAPLPATDTPVPPPPTSVPPPTWPEPLAGQTLSKIGLHVIRGEDRDVVEFARRVHPRVMKAVDDFDWLPELDAASPNTIIVGRINGQDENWVLTVDPAVAAQTFIDSHLEKYRKTPLVDYWEGWNEYVPTSPERLDWYARFEAARACGMQALGLRAAVGGWAMGNIEYDQMALFLPALEAAHRCGGIFTLHEGVNPVIDCGIVTSQPNVIPGAPALGVPAGPIMLRYRIWYEAYLKPRGLGDLPLVISELAVAGIDPNSPCNGPGGDAWKPYQDFWVQRGYGPDGPRAWVNVLAWYDDYLREDPYVLGATIFTAGAMSIELGWPNHDMHTAIIPLAFYEAQQQ